MRAIVFDMDGTLLDSVPTVSRAYADAIRSLGGPPVSPDEVVANWHVGHTALVLGHFLDRVCGPAEVECFHAHLDPAIAELRPFPGIPALLDELVDAGLRLGVFTAATRRAALSMLAAAGIDDRFRVVVAGDDVGRPKPAPDGLLLAQRQLGVTAEATAYVGDAAVDLACADAAGSLGVHASWGALPGVSAGAHTVAAHPHDVLNLLMAPRSRTGYGMARQSDSEAASGGSADQLRAPEQEGTALISIGSLREEDRAAWEELARGYKAYYRTAVPDEGYEETWQRLRRRAEFHGIGAWSNGKLVGIAHYLFHRTFWMDDSCYLQDLFVEEAARGRGVARALIEQVAEASRERGASRLYWTTKEDNTTARVLYDKVASFNGFIRYDYPLAMTRGEVPAGRSAVR